jgi:hypothetical protein
VIFCYNIDIVPYDSEPGNGVFFSKSNNFVMQLE